ncbi:MAG: ABC transporter ATP-binding protein [Bryobacterales bacterium]
MRNIPPVVGILWEAGGGSVSANAFLRTLAALIPIAALAVGKQIIDLVNQVASTGAPVPDELWMWVALELGLAATGAMLARGIDYVDSLLADKFSRHLSVKTMAHASRLDLASYEDPVFYDKLERARVQATDRLGMIQAMGRLLQLVVTTVSLSAGILAYSPWLLVVLVVCVFPAFLGESHFAFLGYSLNFGQTPARRQLDYLRVLGASRESAKELKLFGLSDELTGRFQRISDEIYGQNVALARKRLWASSLLSLLSIAGYYGCYVWVIHQAATGAISIGALTFLAGAIAGASTNIQAIFSTFSSIADQALFLTDLLEFFATKPNIRATENPLPAPRPIRDGFVFENVSFSYPGNERRVLDGLNFRLEPGQRVALIGQNGQGKTTIVKLLTRLYDPTAGRILLDGVDLREYDVEDLCRQVGVIFQDFMRYEMSARENIAVGRIDSAHDTDDIVLAAQKSRASEVIARLPKGYDQLLGRRFEGGVDLSGGEWQKIALARAYLRDAQVLVLDEPTAALDAQSEYDVFQRFAELTTGKIALLISHRFSTVRMADEILVLEDGKIAERGDHSRLIAVGGRYADMFELQAASYR